MQQLVENSNPKGQTKELLVVQMYENKGTKQRYGCCDNDLLYQSFSRPSKQHHVGEKHSSSIQNMQVLDQQNTHYQIYEPIILISNMVITDTTYNKFTGNSVSTNISPQEVFLVGR